MVERSLTVVTGDWEESFLDKLRVWWETAPATGQHALTKYQDGLIWCIEGPASQEQMARAADHFRQMFPSGKIFIVANTAYMPEVSDGDQGSSDSDAQDGGDLPDPGDASGREPGPGGAAGLVEPEGQPGGEGADPERDAAPEAGGASGAGPVDLAGRRASRGRSRSQAEGPVQAG